MTKPTLVIFSVPFQGHFDILYRAAQVWIKQWRIVFIVCGWANFDFPKCDGSIDYHFLQGQSPLDESCPTQFNFRRAIELQSSVERFFEKQLKGVVDLIIYDFFAIEGFLMAQKMSIPYICSIPAIPSQFDPNHPFFKSKLEAASPLICQINHNWLGFDNDEKMYTTLGGRDIQMVSDGFLVQGQQQFLWGVENLSRSEYEWMDHPIWLSMVNIDTLHTETPKLNIHVCFGTVVTGNVWKQNSSVQSFLIQLYRDIISNCTSPSMVHEFDRLVIVIPWRLEEIRAMIGMEHPKIQWESYVNQQEFLIRSKLLITHGGGNTTREAIHSKTPMLVVPFFGDQHVTAKCVAKHQIGLSMESDDPTLAISTHHQLHKRKSMLNLPSMLQSLIQNNAQYVDNIQAMHEDRMLWKNVYHAFENNLSVPWREGDLLFGTNTDRMRASALFSSNNIDRFHVLNFNRFSKIGDTERGYMPRLIDHYHDCIFDKDPKGLEDELATCKHTQYGKSLMAYHTHLGQHNMLNISSVPHEGERHLWDSCVIGLEFFLNRNVHIHFVIDTFDASKNVATRMELSKIRELWNQHASKIHFYKLSPKLHRIDPEAEQWFGVELSQSLSHAQENQSLQVVQSAIEQAPKTLSSLSDRLREMVGPLFLTQSRVKTLESCLEKINVRRRELNDIVGFRFVQPWTQNNLELAKRLCSSSDLNIYYRKVSERSKVLHCYGTFKGQDYEIQLWPSAIYTCFEYEHDLIYKPKQQLTREMIDKSLVLRVQQHVLQNVIDQTVLVDLKECL